MPSKINLLLTIIIFCLLLADSTDLTPVDFFIDLNITEEIIKVL